MTFAELKEIVTRVVEKLNEVEAPKSACLFADCDSDPGPIYILPPPRP